MDEETKITSDGAITITLPGPELAIQRTITLEQVRASLRSQGWEHTGETEDKSGEMWERVSGVRGGRARHRLWTSPHVSALGSIAAVVLDLAAETGVSPGEMLARIADGPTAAPTMSAPLDAEAAEAARLHARDLAALIEEDSRERDAFFALLSAMGLRVVGAHDLCGAVKGALALAEDRSRAAEREACAATLDERAKRARAALRGARSDGSYGYDTDESAARYEAAAEVCEEMAASIRARGKVSR